MDEIFWVGNDGCLTEGIRSNIFAVIDGVMVILLDDGRLLCGVTRGIILEISKSAGILVEEGLIRIIDSFTEFYVIFMLRNLALVISPVSDFAVWRWYRVP